MEGTPLQKAMIEILKPKISKWSHNKIARSMNLRPKMFKDLRVSRIEPCDFGRDKIDVTFVSLQGYFDRDLEGYGLRLECGYVRHYKRRGGSEEILALKESGSFPRVVIKLGKKDTKILTDANDGDFEISDCAKIDLALKKSADKSKKLGDKILENVGDEISFTDLCNSLSSEEFKDVTISQIVNKIESLGLEMKVKKAA